MDYSFFDGLIDAVFVIGDDRGIVYCNEAAAKLCDSSVRRLAKGKPIYDTIEFSDANLYVMPQGSEGRDIAAPLKEIHFKLKSGKAGKVQIAIQPFKESSGLLRWVVLARDVTLEEVLHAKYHKQLEEKEVYIQQLQAAQKQLEQYSKNLEQMVEARTQEVRQANVMLNAIMNSLGQGFLVIDSEGTCSQFYTKACEEILESAPAHKKIWDVLRIQAKEKDTFHMWLKAIFAEQLPFETMKELGPSVYEHTRGRHVKLDYFPLRTELQKIENVVLVATDQTSEYLANKALEKEKKFAKMVIKLITGKKQFSQFLEGIPASLKDVKGLVEKHTSTIDHETIFRILHTLEGEAATYSATEIWQSARDAQEVIEPLKRGEQVDIVSVRPKLKEKIDLVQQAYDQFLNSNSDLFALVGLGQDDKVEIDISRIERIVDGLHNQGLSRTICAEIGDALLKEPVELLLRHYQDVVAQVAQKLNKNVMPVQFLGSDTRVYLDQYKNLFSSFIHIFRNAVDHGLEPSEEREMMGKNPAGKIQVTASVYNDVNGRWLRIKIQDDGGGIDPARVRNRLKEKYPDNRLAQMTDGDVIQHIFDSGISTKDQVGEFSGRGIGLNAVLVEAQSLGGRAWVESQIGQGSTFIIEVPDHSRVVSDKKAA
jgi:two-component system chemotaxis sensor kinase CheA